MARPENEKFKKSYWETEKPVSPEEVLRLEAKMKLALRVKKLEDETYKEAPAPVDKTEEEKEKERIEYMRSRTPRHLGVENG